MPVTRKSYEQLSQNVGMLHASTNIGVIQSAGKLYLIDSLDTDDAAEEILEALDSLFPGLPVAAILNTHSHADHVGGNAYIVHATGAQVWATRAAQKSIEYPELQSTLIWGAKPFNRLLTPFYKAEASRVDRFLDEEPTAFENVGIQVIALPGHYADETGLLVHDASDGKTIFFLGDALFGTEMLKKYWIPFMTDPALFRDSVEKIENTPADLYIPSHGLAHTEKTIHEIAELNKMVTLETETLIRNLLRKGPLSAEELLKQVADYAEIKLGLGQFLLIGSTLRSFLSSMNNRGLVSYEFENNRMLWYAKQN